MVAESSNAMPLHQRKTTQTPKYSRFLVATLTHTLAHAQAVLVRTTENEKRKKKLFKPCSCIWLLRAHALIGRIDREGSSNAWCLWYQLIVLSQFYTPSRNGKNAEKNNVREMWNTLGWRCVSGGWCLHSCAIACRMQVTRRHSTVCFIMHRTHSVLVNNLNCERFRLILLRPFDFCIRWKKNAKYVRVEMRPQVRWRLTWRCHQFRWIFFTSIFLCVSYAWAWLTDCSNYWMTEISQPQQKPESIRSHYITFIFVFFC